MQCKMSTSDEYPKCVVLQNLTLVESMDSLVMSGCVPCEPDPEMDRIIEEALRGLDGNNAKKRRSRTRDREKSTGRARSVGVQCELLSNEKALRCLIDQCAMINPGDAGNFKEIVESCAKFTARLSFHDDALTDISASSDNWNNVQSRSNRRGRSKRKSNNFRESVEEAICFEQLEDERDENCSIKKGKLPKKSITNPAKDKKEKDVNKKSRTKENSKYVPKNTRTQRIVNGELESSTNTARKTKQHRNGKTSKRTTKNELPSDENTLTDHSKSISNKKFKTDFTFYSEKYIRDITSRKHSLKSISNGNNLNIKKLARSWYKDNACTRRLGSDESEFLHPNDVFLLPNAVRRNGAKSLGVKNGTFQGEETFRCGKGSKSLVERRKRRRLYSESRWLNSIEFNLMLPEI